MQVSAPRLSDADIRDIAATFLEVVSPDAIQTMAARESVDIELPEVFEPLFTPARYKIYYGGRGGAKSWSFARALIQKACKGKKRILCTREYQNSIADSVHRLLSDQIAGMGLEKLFNVTQNSITSSTGSQFIFKGLQRSIQEIKSTEGIDICWVEEAQSISERSWEILIPTIRADESEIWISFNPDEESDPTYQRFVVHTPPNSILRKVGFQDNPYFPATLERERLYMQRIDPDAYEHIWGGHCRKMSDAVIFKGRFEVTTFDPPAKDVRLFYGADWGFSQDPTALIRCWVDSNILYIDYEAWGIGVELDYLPDMFRAVPGAEERLIKADNSRPETISHMRRRGFNVEAAPKWKGCVEDGITVMKGFEKILIHERCPHTAEEFRLYSYKVDKLTNEILPHIVDQHNHCIDATRYALSSIVRQPNFFDDCEMQDYPEEK